MQDLQIVPTSSASIYICCSCKDTGYLRLDVQPGHSQFGKAIVCACTQSIQKERHQQRLIDMSGIVRYARYRDATFDTFNKRALCVRSAYANAKSFADDPDGWLVLLGGRGCGKTHLLVSAAKARLAAGDTVFVQTVPDLLDQLRSAFDPHAKTVYNILFEQMRTAEILFLDDYGAENSTPWAIEKLFQMLNYRYNAMLPTFITSNNIGMENIDPRIKSRLTDGELVTMVNMLGAKDYRPNLKKVDKVESEK